jgi:MbtH protein
MNSFQTFTVVINQEEQHSIWPTELPIPAGWHALECSGSKEICLAYISEHWKDIRPLSLRQSLGEVASQEVGPGTDLYPE